ncbi:MAG: transglutaminase-like domain-containing protein [Bacteroidetes bacterium]|nr:transglutaminase-like domain-containing protein [Bacteroidota bacterium]
MRTYRLFFTIVFLIIHFQHLKAGDTLFVNPYEIYISSRTIVKPSKDEVEWGVQLLKTLDLEGLSNYEKASLIENYIAQNFKYRIKSPRSIQSIIDKKGGNCVSHTIMGLFLLRLAGIPAKMCHEFHIKNYFIIDQWRANSAKAGHFGAGHNSHYWLMFFDGNKWQPYDSALDICGFDEFFSTRTKTSQWPYLLSFNPRRMTGAPFIIMQETGNGMMDMKNITKEVWSYKFEWNNKKLSRNEWIAFINLFEGKNTKDFIYPISLESKKSINQLSKKWF